MTYARLISTLFLSFLLTVGGFAQLSKENTKLLRKELIANLNDHRSELGLSVLQADPILKKAAILHSQYMSRNDTLTHFQKSKRLRDPKSRVLQSGGFIFISVGENVLKSAPVPLRLKSEKVKIIAKEMFLGWKNSPGHYANMIDPEFTFGDFGFALDKQNKVIYATHVLGHKGSKIPNQLSEDSFGLKRAPKSCAKQWKNYTNIVANLGNAVAVGIDEVTLFHHNAYFFDKILMDTSAAAIAIDLLTRDQFQCGKPNALHFHPVHDGVLLQPVEKSQIIQNNRAQSAYRIISSLGNIPDSLNESQLSASLILINHNKSCAYLSSGTVPSQQYELRKVEPRLTNPEINLLSGGIASIIPVDYSFKTNTTTPATISDIPKSINDIHSIDIKSYSSIDGDSISNNQLHIKRANYIERHLSNEFKTEGIPISKSTSENWNEMYFQLHYYGLEDISELPKDSIRSYAKSNKEIIPWDSLFHDQRKSWAHIRINGTFTPSNKETGNLLTALESKNYALANQALFEIYQNKKASLKDIFDANIINELIYAEELAQNTAAILSELYTSFPRETILFLFHWHDNAEGLSENTKFNLIHLYSLIGTYLLDEWDISASRLANVVHPNKIKKIKIDILTNELLLNQQLTFLEYFGAINNGPEISAAFDYVSNYFKKQVLSTQDDIDLALFYNR